ncbi:MAG: YgiQ family radical SAM protein [Oceanicoccus sp.]|uniref:YgiQ family radical SAM protein n=1 Tax=Oceanicoccus sp. TaxID=2691044 RepID=UPI002618C89C|nr:YgiQ family radical SAM protein [Oceanicoccus sp.]MCP3907390.1 YgiQ family radical SAM protein [Oceanicoccus sp.]MDG1771990.1 YgiQ family radical SAM protein [Oceanicoccus sp.]
MKQNQQTAKPLFSYRKYWAECYGPAPFLPMSRAEMDELGWDSCDIIIVTGDAYVDHPSFGMAVIGRTLEAQGFRVGIISQPDWRSKDAFQSLGKPNLFFGVAAGNMDSMINRYTADRKLRHDDAYSPNDEGGRRPDRAVAVYSQRCKEAFKGVPVIIGSIEASLRRIAHYDYWSDKVRRSVLMDSKADLLVYGNAERAIIDIAHRIANGEDAHQIRDIRGTAFVRKRVPDGWTVIDSSTIDSPGKVTPHLNPYEVSDSGGSKDCDKDKQSDVQTVTIIDPLSARKNKLNRDTSVIRLPAYEKVKSDPVLYAHASRVLHLETNPGNARALVQQHGEREVWLNPPPIPLETDEMDGVFGLPYQRVPHPSYGDAKIPAFDMIKNSVNIMRGCFGGCTFCSITEHEGRIIQSRSKESILQEIENIRDKTPGFTGVISDLGGPTANMWRLNCKSKKIEQNCRRLSCVYPNICKSLDTDQMPLVDLYRDARELPGIKKILIASGLRYDLAVETPEYVQELVTHHVGGYLKIAPEHTEGGPLSKMMKPGMGTYDRFKKMFEKYSKLAGKKQYLIPYFIAAHPGTTDEDMMNLALWLKRNEFRADQVQAFYPSPMASATAMYYSERNPLKKVGRNTERVITPRGHRHRRLHKAFLRYHDADNWPMLREALKEMGRADLIGTGKKHLIPPYQPKSWVPPKGQLMQTQHTGLPPRADGSRVKRNKPGTSRPKSRKNTSSTSRRRR